MKDSKFSAFRLFYDDFIYKNHPLVDYTGIEDIIVDIRNISRDMRNTFPGNKEYMKKLNDIHLKFKKLVEKAYELNEGLFKVYYELYKKKSPFGNDSEKDMPFVISTSFYNDYRLDDDGTLDYTILIPRYTSLEKKEIRDVFRAEGLIGLFIFLLKKSKGNYNTLITRINYLKSLNLAYNESLAMFNERFNEVLDDINGLINKCEEKAHSSIDYYNIKDAFEVVYKKKYDSWVSLLDEPFKQLLKDIYDKDKQSKKVIYFEAEKNDISFEDFENYCSELVVEKEKNMEIIANGNSPKIDVDRKEYCADFRKKLMEEYFDKRLYFKLPKDGALEKVANIGYNLGLFAGDLINHIFEKNKFDAAYSRSLARNNDVKSAIVRKLYELYDPCYLLSIYEEKRQAYLKYIKNMGEDYERQVTYLTNKIAANSSLSSELLTEKKILSELVNKRYNFVLENIDDLKSQDIFEYYDTRNYDLEVILMDIDTNSLVKLYAELKKKINNNEFSSNTCITGEYNDKKIFMLEALLELFVKVLAERESRINFYNNEKLRIKVYKNIALDYLGEKIYEDVHEDEDLRNRHLYSLSKEIFDIDSNYNKLKDLL